MKNGADAIIQMDGDLSHSSDDVSRLLQKLPQADVVVGSRYIPGGQLDQRWSHSRRLLSWWANSVWVRTVLGLKTKDATSGFKCWRRSALEAALRVFEIRWRYGLESVKKILPSLFPHRTPRTSRLH